MSMLAYDGSVTTVYNPFTIEELRAKMDAPASGLALDPFLQCAAKGTKCDLPSDPVFDAQQVNASRGSDRATPPPCPPSGRLQPRGWLGHRNSYWFY